MLLEYTFSNFRSFKNETTLSMVAGPQRTLNDNLIKKDDRRILPATVIYGANASGKSNVIMSLSLMREIILAGSLYSNQSVINRLETYPFFYHDQPNPMTFEIEFIHRGLHVKYGFGVFCSSFQKGDRKIVSERFSVITNGSAITLFERNTEGVVLMRDKKALDLMNTEKAFLVEFSKKVNTNLGKDELFLPTVFKNALSSNLADVVIDFFRNRLVVVSDFSSKKAVIEVEFEGVDIPDEDFLVWNNALDKFTRNADFGPQTMAYRRKEGTGRDSGEVELVSFYQHGTRKIMVSAELMESRGTLKLLDFALPFEILFKKGGVFVLDEFDASIHPELIKGIIGLFNDSDLNTQGAQLIFTTHNPIYLNNQIFRRDQIRFVEKSQDTLDSALYSLADFGSTEVRNDHNYLLNYFKGNYGALPFIDFSQLIRDDNDSRLSEEPE